MTETSEFDHNACQSKSHRWSQYDDGVRHCKDCGQIDAHRIIGDADKPTEPGLLDYPTDDFGGLQPHDAWGGPDSGDADKQAQQAADAIGVTPHSDMRPFVEQAVKYALTHPAPPVDKQAGRTHLDNLRYYGNHCLEKGTALQTAALWAVSALTAVTSDERIPPWIKQLCGASEDAPPADKQAGWLVENDPSLAFLQDTARYFENRPTGGEDRAHWANVYNAENARKVAAQLAVVERERNRANEVITEVSADLTSRIAAVERERDEAINSVADMAERFRAVNVSEAIKQTIGENVFALRERAEAAEAKVLALTTANRQLHRRAQIAEAFMQAAHDIPEDWRKTFAEGMHSDNQAFIVFAGTMERIIQNVMNRRERARAALEQASKAGGGA